jgi:hypothetical protein
MLRGSRWDEDDQESDGQESEVGSLYWQSCLEHGDQACGQDWLPSTCVNASVVSKEGPVLGSGGPRPSQTRMRWERDRFCVD